MAKSVILSSDPNYFICDCTTHVHQGIGIFLLVLLFSMFTSEMVLIS